jgi:hypothetical protein
VVRKILTSKEYIGYTVNHKVIRPTYKKRITKKLDRSEWQFIENAHEAIVTEEVFYKVQSTLTKGEPIPTFDYINPLKGLVFCADCGAAMSNKRMKPQQKKDKNSNPTCRYTNPRDDFECRTYTVGLKHHERICSRHMIPSDALNTLILETLKELYQACLSDEKTLIRKPQSSNENQLLNEYNRDLSQKRKRFDELEELMQGAFEANFKGNLTDSRLEKLLTQYESEQEQLGLEIEFLASQVKEQEEQKADSRSFIKRLKAVTSFETLTPDMISELIDKIVVYEKIGTRRSYQQEVELYFKFVGVVKFTPREGVNK